MDRFEPARAAVAAAFEGVPRPTDAELLHPRCGDGTDLEPLLPYDDWRAVPAVMSTVWSLQPSLYDDDLAAYVRSKLVLLDDAQRAAVVGTLEALVGHQDVEGALADWD